MKHCPDNSATPPEEGQSPDVERRLRRARCFERVAETLQQDRPLTHLLDELVAMLANCWSRDGDYAFAIRRDCGTTSSSHGAGPGSSPQRSLPITVGGHTRAHLQIWQPGRASGTPPRLAATDVDMLERVARMVAQLIQRKETESERDRLLRIVDETPDFISMARGSDGLLTFINRSGLMILGQDTDQAGRPRQLPPELAGHYAGQLVHPEWARERVLRQGLPTAERHGTWQDQTAFIDDQGREIPTSQVIIAHYDEAGEVAYYSTIMRDISEVHRREKLHSQILEALLDGVFGLDRDGRFAFLNAAAVRMLGLPSEEAVIGESAHPLIHHSHADGTPHREADCPIREVATSGKPLDAWRDTFWRADGTALPVEVFATPLDAGADLADGVVVSFRDISRRRMLEAELERLAYSDRLTGAANRRRFEALLEQEMERNERYGAPLSLIMIDLDHFKRINDRHGHEVGDGILAGLAGVVQQHLRSVDVFGRWGGEEFVVLLPHTRLTGAAESAERLRRSLAATDFPTVGQVTASLGYAEYTPGATQRNLLRRLDDAVYAAKAAGRNVCVAARSSATTG